MIETISISSVATYAATPELLEGLSKFNFLFGSNGTGKTTISRVIADETKFSTCPRYQERCHPSYSQTRGLDGAEQCVVTARRSRLMSEGG
jgi:replication-associated recombination protein RarA